MKNATKKVKLITGLSLLLLTGNVFATQNCTTTISDYMVVGGNISPEGLSTSIVGYSSQGWQLVGGINVVYAAPTVIQYYQAMDKQTTVCKDNKDGSDKMGSAENP